MNRAFTLLEMTIVMLLVAIATHLAVAEFSRVRDRKLVAAADRQLEEISRAIWDVRESPPAGFLADMGRMPVMVDGTLSELWNKPGNIPDFAVKPATAANLCVSEEDKVSLADGGVFVPTGWRGPYLKLPFSKKRLRDPWGNPIEAEDDAGLKRIWTTNGCVCAVSHYGAEAMERGLKTLSVEPDGGTRSSLTVTCEVVSDSPFAGTVEYKWYGPASGMVTGAVSTVQYPSAVRFEGLTPGTVILKDSLSGVARPVAVMPGENFTHLRISK